MFQARIVSSLCISAALALTLLIPVVAAAQAAPNVVKNIVLVHGAFADGTSWSKVIPLLEADGYHVVAVQNPLTSLADDTTRLMTSTIRAGTDPAIVLKER